MIKSGVKHLITIFIVLMLLVTISAQAKWHEQNAGIMGTNIRAEVWHTDTQLGEQALASVMQEMERINQLMSPYIETSELSLLNRDAMKGPVVVSDEMFDILSLSKQLSELSEGAFDITFASVGYLYNYREKQRPDAAEIQPLLEAINYRHIVLDAKAKTVFFAHPKVKIDLGGIAKGYAVDNAIAALKEMGIEHALVTAGGDTKLLGDRMGKPWVVGIRDPRNAEKEAVLIPLADAAMSTSGDYERYFEEDGKRYHHILSPTTGASSYEVQSVSIIGPESVYNDALSTAVFVMGLERGIGLINSLKDYEAIVMDNNRRMHYSNGLGQ
ncbi:FAD:protein FMN transferase [Glaciecola sp. XM2]|jgi:thiamine biosynthesis lipoprotein|uniref:FAD:protein FMN transferase n=1 Tax=Glaciecola sp. XM2 TaxID=1914931 RepID=UPI001BDE4A84|nr:FAD:protein FMN transferase [Glaciecola sp. XM2]MBT1451559.1 FAD:protein FMN transferase [Glaciecola sp. XM2]